MEIVVWFTLAIIYLVCGFMVAGAVTVHHRNYDYRKKGKQSRRRVYIIYTLVLALWTLRVLLWPLVVLILPGRVTKTLARHPEWCFKGCPFHATFLRNMMLRRAYGMSPRDESIKSMS